MRMKNVNIAFMAKLGWKILTDKKDLWTQVLTSKYIRGKVTPEKFMRKRGTSNAWNGIAEANSLLKKGLKVKVYNGKDTLFRETLDRGNLPF